MHTDTLTRTSERSPTHYESNGDGLTELDDERLNEISQDPILAELTEEERKEVISDTLELYLKTREYIAPVITGFADSLLKEAGSDKQIIFAARDGLGPLEAAQALLQKFPDTYGKTNANQLAYLYLTRAVVANSGNMIRDYVEQEGLDADAPTLVADIGMYGTIMYDLTEMLPRAEARYVISQNSRIPGYIVDSRENRSMDSIRSIVGNPVIHFLEDTFSGTTSSPKRLVETAGTIVPDMKADREAYAPRELMKRKYAAKAFGDYVSGLDTPPMPEERMANVSKLDAFLLDSEQYRHLMVPHVR